jgi:hypothetical protein
MSESENWQPVRIAPLEHVRRCPDDFDDGSEWPEGRIVRVRLLGLSPCGVRRFRIHPDDNWGLKTDFCEHQILAD